MAHTYKSGNDDTVDCKFRDALHSVVRFRLISDGYGPVQVRVLALASNQGNDPRWHFLGRVTFAVFDRRGWSASEVVRLAIAEAQEQGKLPSGVPLAKIVDTVLVSTAKSQTKGA